MEGYGCATDKDGCDISSALSTRNRTIAQAVKTVLPFVNISSFNLSKVEFISVKVAG